MGELGEEKIKPRPEQLTVAMSMESEVYYNSLANERFMKKFDVEMTYRPRSQVLHVGTPLRPAWRFCWPVLDVCGG